MLRYLARVFGNLPEVEQTSLFPANRQESLVVVLDTEYYPESIEAVRFEIRIYTSGEFHISYIERYLGELRRCRWDRHEQNHNSRDHFHPLPKARTTAAKSCDFPADVTTLVRKDVLPWVEQRLGELWDETSSGTK